MHKRIIDLFTESKKSSRNFKVFNPTDELPKAVKYSIFLAGPSPRDGQVLEWREAAISEFEKIGFEGTIFNPENPNFTKSGYDDQIEWEKQALERADVILFWVPRDMPEFPALTTNVEYGIFLKSNKCIFGCPKDSDKNEYLIEKAKQNNIKVFHDLDKLVKESTELFESGEREDGEVTVPLLVWNTKMFQSWYESLKENGNRLDGAEVLWNFKAPKNKNIFSYLLKADIYVEEEDRNKDNEFIFSRTDVSTILGYRKGKNLGDTEIVLVKEFRTPVCNSEGYVFELVGGSSFDESEDKFKVALKEFEEETGLEIDDSSRLKEHTSRQLASTMLTHKSHLFSIELTDEEIDYMKSIKDEVLGVSEDTEIIHVVVKTLDEIIENDYVDYANLGMIMQVLHLVGEK